MLVGLCPNPLCSASGGCRLRIFAKCFFDLSADACGIGTFCTDGFPEAENRAIQHIRDCAILNLHILILRGLAGLALLFPPSPSLCFDQHLNAVCQGQRIVDGFFHFGA